ncbi:MAG: magnesium/cobalt transporter CorA [Betaproteobacteria bacterium]|nr:magnesium/cobalt transporter CorA [Betaproteobacteria bacterium]
MINAFEIVNGRLKQTHIESLGDLARAKPIWVDFDSPSEEEQEFLQDIFGPELPDDEDEIGNIEASARYFQDDAGRLHIRSDFLLDDDEEGACNVPVAFTLKNDVLYSLHHEDLPVFRLVRMRARVKPGSVEDAMDVLLDLYGTNAEYSADSLEEIYETLKKISERVLTSPLSDDDAAEVLAGIAQEEDLNGRIRRNVMDTRRAVSFLMRNRLITADQAEEARQILRDIDSLDSHTSFLFDKINFLMDATVGFININQNKIIKIFSVAAVAMLPPTLIASIYGMNFKFMPELEWELGYVFSIALMLCSVVAPFWYFRRKGWLR